MDRLFYAYAHPIHSPELPIPVDSAAERRTLDLLPQTTSAAAGRPVRISKPLFDLPLAEATGWAGFGDALCRPGFLVELEKSGADLRIVVETIRLATGSIETSTRTPDSRNFQSSSSIQRVPCCLCARARRDAETDAEGTCAAALGPSCMPRHGAPSLVTEDGGRAFC